MCARDSTDSVESPAKEIAKLKQNVMCHNTKQSDRGRLSPCICADYRGDRSMRQKEFFPSWWAGSREKGKGQRLGPEMLVQGGGM